MDALQNFGRRKTTAKFKEWPLNCKLFAGWAKKLQFRIVQLMKK